MTNIYGIESLNGGALGKNLVIGGDFSTNPFQRGNSWSGEIGQFIADRFVNGITGTGRCTHAVDTDVPTAAEAGCAVSRSLKIQCSIAQPVLNASDTNHITQRIEGNHYVAIAQRSFTVSFWVKSTMTGTFTVLAANAGVDRTFVREYTINQANTWEKKTLNFSAPPSSGTWDYLIGAGLILTFWLAAGTNTHGVAGSWQTDSKTSTANQTNFVSSTSNIIRFALIQLEAGDVATAFHQRSFAQEFDLCRRYYEKSHPISVAPTSSNSAYYEVFETRVAIAISVAGNLDYSTRFAVRKRTTPTVTLYALTGTTGAVTVNSGTRVGCTAGVPNETGFSFIAVSNAGGIPINADDFVAFGYAANAEI